MYRPVPNPQLAADLGIGRACVGQGANLSCTLGDGRGLIGLLELRMQICGTAEK
jgi:hypothetical protein